MKIHHSLDAFDAKNIVLTIGTFDGVHQGHNKLIETLKNRAIELQGESVVMTFWPHPRLVLQPDNLDLSLLCTLDERIDTLSLTGIDHLIVFPFTMEFSKTSSRDFIEQVLVQQLHVKHLVVGYDHAFGHKREGNYEYLEQCAKQYDFSIERVDALNVEAINVSSTKIRNALLAGDLAKANKYLNHPYYLSGEVISGQRLGRTIGYPTINVDVERFKLVPRDGVYAVEVECRGERYRGMLNVGIRPTVNDPRHNKTIEAHLFDFSQDIYGENVKVYFAQRMRDEVKFSSIDALRKQLATDEKEVLAFFKKRNKK